MNDELCCVHYGVGLGGYCYVDLGSRCGGGIINFVFSNLKIKDDLDTWS